MRILIPLLILLSAAFAQQKRELPWEKNRAQIGQALYRENCVVCHDIDVPSEKSIKLGPSFYQLFKQQAMPKSGKPVELNYVKTLIRFGNGGLMPAFAKKMTAAEMDQLIDYIASK